MDFEQDRKRKRDGEGSASTSASSGVDGADTSQFSLMAMMKATLESNTSQMKSMQSEIEEMKNRISRVDELEDRCSLLESRCGSLERTMHSMTKNKEWNYSAPDIPWSYWEEQEFHNEEDISLYEGVLACLKDQTHNLRNGCKFDVCLEMGGHYNDYMEHHDVILPHWREFADAIQAHQHSEASGYSDNDTDTKFSVLYVKLIPKVLDMLALALRGKKIKELRLMVNHFLQANDGIEFVMKLLQHNPWLTRFTWIGNILHNQHEANTLAGVLSHSHYLEYIDLGDSCGPNVNGYDLLCKLITDNPGLKQLFFGNYVGTNFTRTEGSPKLFVLIATNPPLEVLSLTNSEFDDNDISMLSDALRQNTRLVHLGIDANIITDEGCNFLADALGANSTLNKLDLGDDILISSEGCKTMERAVFDQSSLNAVACSNHVCQISTTDNWLNDLTPKINCDNKIFNVLCSRHRECSNAYHLDQEMVDEESLKLVPRVLEIPARRMERCLYLRLSLSIMYELLRSWKMPSLYEARPTRS